MRVVVTGCAGFIGSRLVELLLARGAQVLGIDNLSLGQAPTPNGPRYEFRRADIRNPQEMAGLFERFQPERLVHLAAIHHIPTCEANPAMALDVNVVGTQVLLEAARTARCERVVFTSSGAVYDWCDGPLVPGRTPVRPRDVYSVSKVTNEYQLAAWQEHTGGTVVVARVFNTIGAHDRNAHLIPDLLCQLQLGRAPNVVRLGNTATRRDYIYVDDTTDALLCMVVSELRPGGYVFNVGTGQEYTVVEVVERLAAIMGVSYTIEHDPARLRRIDRPSQQADIASTVEQLEWRPRCSLDEALRLTVAGG